MNLIERSHFFSLFFSKPKKVPSAKKRTAMPNIVDDIKSGDITEIQSMPAGNDKPKVPRIPSPLPFQKESSRDNINLDYVRCQSQCQSALLTWQSVLILFFFLSVLGFGRSSDHLRRFDCRFETEGTNGQTKMANARQEISRRQISSQLQNAGWNIQEMKATTQGSNAFITRHFVFKKFVTERRPNNKTKIDSRFAMNSPVETKNLDEACIATCYGRNFRYKWDA